MVIQSVTCFLQVKDKKIPVNVILDSGSNSCNVDETLATELGLEPISEYFDRHVRYITRSVKLRTCVFSLRLVGQDQKYVRDIFAYSVSNFKTDVPNWRNECSLYSHLDDLVIPEAESSVARILIGVDCIDLFRPTEVRYGQPNEPMALKTALGWSFQGPHPKVCADIYNSICVLTHNRKFESFKSKDDDLHELIERSLTLEEWNLKESDLPFTKGYKGGPKPPELWTESERIAEEKMVVEFIAGTGTKPDHFQARIPWKDCYKQNLSGNFNAVRRRQLKTFSASSLQKKGITEAEVRKIFESYLEKGYIEPVPEFDVQNGWYLPFFCVVNRAKVSTPVRPVFDAKSTFNGISLNNQIMATPNRLNDLVSTLLNFRRFEFGIMADISEMFLRVRLHPEDRQYHRFVLFDEAYQWTRILFGNNSSPNISQKTLTSVCDLYGKDYPLAEQCVRERCYMDDGIDSKSTEKELIQLALELPQLLEKADMKMAKFYSNSEKTLRALEPSLVAKEVHLFEDKNAVFESNKVLGMVWDASTDTFGYRAKYEKVEEWLDKWGVQKWTKRTVLKTTASTYDPLGYLSPVTVYARSVIQKLWTLKLDWDDAIPDEIAEVWVTALSNLLEVKSISLPRWTGYAPGVDLELHCFCDASETAYACVVFTRVNSRRGLVTRILMAKSRVAPIQSETISRLELIACVLGVRLTNAINKVFKVAQEKIHYWTDSRNALCWIHTPSSRLKVYVQNRVGEIQRNTEVKQWHHVSTDENPADIATRYIATRELLENEIWWTGPPVLQGDTYPGFHPNGIPAEVTKEMKNEGFSFCSTTEKTHLDIMDFVKESVGKLYNGYHRVLKLLMNVVRVVTTMRKQKLTETEIREKAYSLLIRQSQLNSFEHEIDTILDGKQVSSRSPLGKHNPFIDELGILRSSSRLTEIKNISHSGKYPIILSSKCTIAKMIAINAHIRYQHTVSLNNMIIHLHSEYVILGLSKLIRTICRECLHCRRAAAKQQPQIMAPIKRSLSELRAFAEVGIDFAGPFYIKIGRGKQRKNMFVLVITCLQTRAVHFEVTEDQTTSAVLMALTRFACSQGCPTRIVSDNQTSFKSAEKELLSFLKDLDYEAISRRLGVSFEKATVWEFIPPRAPHFGGSWEIMVKAMKRAVKVVANGADYTEDQFRTFVAQAASLLNARPLTRMLIRDKVTIVTPNSFIRGNYNIELVPTSLEKKYSRLGARYLLTEKMSREVWKQFIHELLPELRPRTKWLKTFPNLEVGQLVLVIDKAAEKGEWKLAIVEQVNISEDGKVRSATVRIGDRTYDRPVIDLFPLLDQYGEDRV